MTNRTLSTIAATIAATSAAILIAGCNKGDHTIVAGSGDSTASNLEANGPVALPPVITATKIYRCADSQVVYVDWLSDGKSASVRTEPTGSRTQVTAPEAGKPMTADGGFELDGSSSAANVHIAVPGHPSQSCKA